MSFLASFWGQLLLAASGVLGVVIAKSFSRRPEGRHRRNPFVWDEFAIGLDLIVLSLVTLAGYAVSQYRAELAAQGVSEQAVRQANENQSSAWRWMVIGFVVFVITAWLIQWLGQLTIEERAAWKQKRFEELKKNKPAAPLKQSNLSTTDADLALAVPEPPRYTMWWGRIFPNLIGILILFFAIQVVTK